MFGQIIACLDGSSFAEKILPVARCMTASTGGRLTLLRIVQDAAELAAEEQYLRDAGGNIMQSCGFGFQRTRPTPLLPSSIECPAGLRR